MATHVNKTQISGWIPDKLKKQLNADAKKFRKAKDGILSVIIADFFASWDEDERAKFYAKLPAKVLGRPTQ